MSNGNDWYRNKLIELRAIFGNKCAQCGSRDNLEFAHIAGTGLHGAGRGRNRRILDIMHNMDKYVLLCRKHHGEFDGFLPGKDLSTQE